MANERMIPKEECSGAKASVQQSVIADYVGEREAAEILGISERTLRNYVYSGKITDEMYIVNVIGRRFYNKSKIMGL